MCLCTCWLDLGVGPCACTVSWAHSITSMILGDFWVLLVTRMEGIQQLLTPTKYK
jgi:hypothetical protein